MGPRAGRSACRVGFHSSCSHRGPCRPSPLIAGSAYPLAAPREKMALTFQSLETSVGGSENLGFLLIKRKERAHPPKCAWPMDAAKEATPDQTDRPASKEVSCTDPGCCGELVLYIRGFRRANTLTSNPPV